METLLIMPKIHFTRYLARFESMVGKGVEQGLLGRVMPVNVHEGKLHYTRYARFMGNCVEHEIPFAIDYYGYYKKSYGFIRYLQEVQEELVGKQIKTLDAILVIFNSIRVEDIQALSEDEYLLWGFTEFKNIILDRRGLGNKRRVITSRESRPLQTINTS